MESTLIADHLSPAGPSGSDDSPAPESAPNFSSDLGESGGAGAVIERMQAALGARTQTELALRLGVRKAAITDAKRRGHAPSEWLLKLCLEHGLNPGWLMTGAGPQYVHGSDYPADRPASCSASCSDDGAREARPESVRPNAFGLSPGQAAGRRMRGGVRIAGPAAAPPPGEAAARPFLQEPQGEYRPGQDEFELVPMVEARPIMGRGGLEHGGEVRGYYAFRRDWLVRKGRIDSLRLMRVSGVSMEPTLRDEDMALVDLSRTDVLPGKIYVLRIDDELTVKRLDKRPGSLVLISDNHGAYPPWEIRLSETENVQIIGRVIWMAREII